jgi:hypothetical protein
MKFFVFDFCIRPLLLFIIYTMRSNFGVYKKILVELFVFDSDFPVY